jgi:hypothetical protein
VAEPLAELTVKALHNAKGLLFESSGSLTFELLVGLQLYLARFAETSCDGRVPPEIAAEQKEIATRVAALARRIGAEEPRDIPALGARQH